MAMPVFEVHAEAPRTIARAAAGRVEQGAPLLAIESRTVEDPVVVFAAGWPRTRRTARGGMVALRNVSP
jgi:hypothetical protein